MDLDALIRSQHGVCSRSQARAAGLSDDRLRWRVTSGRSVTRAEQTVLDLADVPGVEWREAVATAARWVQKRRTTAASLAESVMEVSYVRRVEEPHGLPRAAMQVRAG